MKTTLLVACLLFASAAFAQQAAPVLPNVVQPFLMPEHPQHASQHDMAQRQDILEHSDYTYAQGERPISDFAEAKPQPSLGDIARAYRLEHEAMPKAAFVFEKYVASK